MERRDLALTVLELEENEFYWVVMEAVQADADDLLCYRPIDSATKAAKQYSNALIEGAAAIRHLQGLAPFGPPRVTTGMGESAFDASITGTPSATPRKRGSKRGGSTVSRFEDSSCAP